MQLGSRKPYSASDCNQGYRYGSYREVFRRYFWRAKDPVPHPLMRR